MSIEIRGLNIAIGTKPIVRDVCMGIADGERVGLVGSSGSDKSMIAKALMGLLPDTARISGSIMVGGKQLIGLDDTAMADLRGRYMGMVFQNPAAALNPVMTVAQQVGLPLYLHSGGQQQRVGIATALITSPRFIIADEPTTALDSITQRQIVDLLTSLVDDAGASMLFITHDFAVLARATTRCYVLDGGSIAETGTTASDVWSMRPGCLPCRMATVLVAVLAAGNPRERNPSGRRSRTRQS